MSRWITSTRQQMICCWFLRFQEFLGAAAPGSRPPIVNAGSVENKGFEFQIAYREDISDDFRFNISYNMTYLKNEVTFVPVKMVLLPVVHLVSDKSHHPGWKSDSLLVISMDLKPMVFFKIRLKLLVMRRKPMPHPEI